MAPGILGAAGIAVAGGASLPSLASAVVLSGFSIVVGRRLVRSRDRGTEAQAAAPMRDPAFESICAKSCSVWARQIETSRLAADDAILRLTRSFEGTVGRLETTLGAARSTLSEIKDNDGVLGAVARGEGDLRHALQSLVAAQKQREQQVGVHARALRDMAADVQRIAMQIRILSFNAAVEAAHAGASAGGFGVVASEMRELATVSGETGANMVRKVEVIGATLDAMVRGEGRGRESEIDSVAAAETAIRDVTQRFTDLAGVLSEAVRVMEAKTREVHVDVSDALVAMQFQDRVSQIQQHVVNGLTALRDSVARADGSAYDIPAWEERLSREFSTPEEHENLGDRRSAAAPRASHEMTFF